MGPKVGQSFKMEADFTNTGQGQCSCCEYRQDVKGYAKYRPVGGAWITISKPLNNGVIMEENTFHEDGTGGVNTAFGHRGFAAAPDDIYRSPDRATGCEYRGTDFPGLSGLSAGMQFDINLTFRGRIIDVCNGDAILGERTWTVRCCGVWPIINMSSCFSASSSSSSSSS